MAEELVGALGKNCDGGKGFEQVLVGAPGN
jgi:hypothetical protein